MLELALSGTEISLKPNWGMVITLTSWIVYVQMFFMWANTYDIYLILTLEKKINNIYIYICVCVCMRVYPTLCKSCLIEIRYKCNTYISVIYMEDTCIMETYKYHFLESVQISNSRHCCCYDSNNSLINCTRILFSEKL